MSEELNQEGTQPEQLEQNDTQEVKQPTEIEQRALSMGWRPREEFNGSDDDFIDAKEFVRRKPLFDKIEHSSKEIKELRKAFTALTDHYTKVKESEYNRAMAALKSARSEAISTGDGARFDVLDEEIKRVEQEAAAVKNVAELPATPEVHPTFVAWQNRNPWYNTERHMRVFADDYGRNLAAQGMQPDDVLKAVEKAVRQEYPNKFRNPNKDAAPDLDTGRQSGTKKETFKLTDQERRVMETLVRSDPKKFSREKYIEEVKKLRGN